MFDSLENFLDGASMIVIGGWLAMVELNNRHDDMMLVIKHDALPFVEFVTSLYIAKLIVENDRTGIFAPLAFLAFLASVLNLAGKFSIGDAFAAYGEGKIGLFEFVKRLTSMEFGNG